MKKIEKIFVAICLLAITNLTAQSYELPAYKSFKLKNGLTVYLMEQHDVPVISVSAVLPAGAIYDGRKSGLASLTASSLKLGTQHFTKKQLDEALDFIGASVTISASKEFTNLSSKFATKDQEKVLNIIKELLVNPSFDQTEFNKEKSRLLVSLNQQKESPKSMINSYFNKLLYGNHVYGNLMQGTISTVKTLKINDVKSFYHSNFIPQESAISIVGDFNANKMKKTIKILFSSWKKGKHPTINLAAKTIKKPTKTTVVLVNKDDARETTFYIGSPGVAKSNKDLIAIQVVNTLFGGRFTSMLNDELRVNSGLTYGAGSRFLTLKNGGAFYISTFTANKTTEQAVDKTLEILNKLHKNGLNEKSLASAKNYVKGQFPPNYETTGQLAGLLTQLFWYDLDKSYINNFEKNVDGLDLKKANAIIKKYFPTKNLQFVLIGKASLIKSIAKKYGPVTEYQIKDDIDIR